MSLLNMDALVHVALFSEARPIIDYFDLKQHETKPFKIFRSRSTLLIVSGVGEANTLAALKHVYSRYRFRKAVNVGLAGCSNHRVSLGSLYRCFGAMDEVPFLPLSTHNEPVTGFSGNHVSLVDMEGEYFLDYVRQFHSADSIWILKVVSDYLSDRIPDRNSISTMIKNTLSCLDTLLTS